MVTLESAIWPALSDQIESGTGLSHLANGHLATCFDPWPKVVRGCCEDRKYPIGGILLSLRSITLPSPIDAQRKNQALVPRFTQTREER